MGCDPAWPGAGRNTGLTGPGPLGDIGRHKDVSPQQGVTTNDVVTVLVTDVMISGEQHAWRACNYERHRLEVDGDQEQQALRAPERDTSTRRWTAGAF